MRESARRRQADTSRILVGYWRESTEPEPNQHAVYGILSRDGTLRFKVVSETRQGRQIQCKSLLTPGDSWIIHDEVVLEPHLRDLNRLEMKEYCRVRQSQIDQGEQGQDIAANILKSVELAKQIAEESCGHERPRNLRWAREKCADERRAMRKLRKRMLGEAASASKAEQLATPGSVDAKPDAEAKTEPEVQLGVQDRPCRPRSFTAIGMGASTVLPLLPARGPDMVPPRRPSVPTFAPPTTDPARRDWHSVIQPRMGFPSPPTDALPRPTPAVSTSLPSPPPPTPPPPPPPQSLRPTQPAPLQTLPPTARETKLYGGIAYEWKDTGLFSQKYVSRGCIITIDDEDYVEYRVLTKPTFI